VSGRRESIELAKGRPARRGFVPFGKKARKKKQRKQRR
jgi:hypothetical protein